MADTTPKTPAAPAAPLSQEARADLLRYAVERGRAAAPPANAPAQPLRRFESAVSHGEPWMEEADLGDWVQWSDAMAAIAAARREERERSAAKAGEYARKWWTEHCRSNHHMATTRKAHDDFCALQVDIRRA